MKYIVFIVLMTLASCHQTNNKKENNKKEIRLPPQSDYYLTSKETIRHVVFKENPENARPTTLSDEEILKVENIIAKRVLLYNKKAHRPIEQPAKYFKQFIPSINPNGEKEVFVYCYCSVLGDSWKKRIIGVSDGGSCYFQLKINLSKGKVVFFQTNGLA
jgi:hypothetical protein